MKVVVEWIIKMSVPLPLDEYSLKKQLFVIPYFIIITLERARSQKFVIEEGVNAGV